MANNSLNNKYCHQANNSLNNNSSHHDLYLTSLNLNGWSQGVLMLKNICSSSANSVIYVQESWLNSDQLSYFDAFKDFLMFLALVQ